MISRQAIPVDINLSTDISTYKKFIDLYDKWIHSSRNTVRGLPGKPFVVSGVTDALNQLYGMYNKIGIYEGEYGYHKLVLEDRVTTNLSQADCIVISHPFSADGLSSHHMLQEADQWNIPIFVDCAFFGACDNIDFDFTAYNNIHSVCFSLSKAFGTGLNRVGLLYTIDKFPTTIYQEWKYPLITQALLHYDLLESRSPDWIVDTYKTKQTRWCEELDLIPSDTVLFGLDYTDKYKEYSRGNVNRVCISGLLNDDVRKKFNDLDRMG